MINHARTLLLNESGANRPTPGFLEEFIDPSFAPVTVPNYIARIQKVLFGENSDSAFRNATVHALMAILHSTEFVDYVKALDSRTTYLNHQSVAQRTSQTSVAKISTTVNTGIVLGDAECHIGNPRVEWLWHVTVISGGPSAFTVNVRWEQGRKEQLYEVAYADGQSELIPLIGQPRLFFKIVNGMLSGEHWAVSLSAVPAVELFSLVSSLKKLGSGTLGKLFPRTAPYTVFEKLWRSHPEISYKLSGLLLALIYQIEEIRIRG